MEKLISLFVVLIMVLRRLKLLIKKNWVIIKSYNLVIKQWKRDSKSFSKTEKRRMMVSSKRANYGNKKLITGKILFVGPLLLQWEIKLFSSQIFTMDVLKKIKIIKYKWNDNQVFISRR